METNIDNNVKYIELSKGKQAIVDSDLFEFLNQWKWCFYISLTSKCGGYAARVDLSSGRRVKISMHRLIYSYKTGIPIKELNDVDHKNGDGLDNRFDNLRDSTRFQNSGNRSTNKNNSSGYKGVKADPKRPGIWIAQIQYEGKKRNLGTYNSAEEAALAYNDAAKEAFGEFAFLNNVEGITSYEKRLSRNSKDYKPKGVSFHKGTNKWIAYVKLETGKRKQLGYFKTEEEAKLAHEEYFTKVSSTGT